MLVLSGRLHEKIVFPGSHTVIEVMAIHSGAVRLGIEVPGEGVPARLLQLEQLIDKRLGIARRGLEELSRHLAAGQARDAETVLEKIDEDLHLLRRRLRQEVEASTPPIPGLYGRVSAITQPN